MDLTIVAAFGLLLVRPGMLVAVAPGLGGVFVPAPVKVGLVVMLALVLAPSVALPTRITGAALPLIVAREAVIGLSLAFALRALVAGAEMAGHMSGYQIGFSYGATIDPQSGVRHTALTSLYGSLATLAFLALNGHHVLLRALHASYAGVPVGSGGVDDSLVASVGDLLGVVFTVGLRLAAPIIVVLFVVEIAVGLISRSVPSLSFIEIGYPVRLVVGLLVLAAVISTVPAVVTSLTDAVVTMAARTAGAFR